MCVPPSITAETRGCLEDATTCCPATCCARRAGFAPGSLLFGRELPTSERVATSWGTHSLVDAGEACAQPVSGLL